MPEAYLGRTYNARDRKLHSDPDCQHLQKCADYREVDPAAHPHKEFCRVCTGDVEQSGGAGNGHYQSLKAAAEARTDGGGCRHCGGPLRREGACETCVNCGASKCGGGRL